MPAMANHLLIPEPHTTLIAPPPSFNHGSAWRPLQHDYQRPVQGLPPDICEYCGRGFSAYPHLVFHQRTCKPAKRGLSSLLEETKQFWEARKRRKIMHSTNHDRAQESPHHSVHPVECISHSYGLYLTSMPPCHNRVYGTRGWLTQQGRRLGLGVEL
jgi:hypothetical protein